MFEKKIFPGVGHTFGKKTPSVIREISVFGIFAIYFDSKCLPHSSVSYAIELKPAAYTRRFRRISGCDCIIIVIRGSSFPCKSKTVINIECFTICCQPAKTYLSMSFNVIQRCSSLKESIKELWLGRQIIYKPDGTVIFIAFSVCFSEIKNIMLEINSHLRAFIPDDNSNFGKADSFHCFSRDFDDIFKI